MSLAPSPASTEEGGGAPVYAGSLDSSGAAQAGHGASPFLQTRTGGRGSQKGQGSLGASTEAAPPPHDLLQDPTRNQLPTSPSRGTPGARLLGVGVCQPERGPRTPKWRPTLKDDRERTRRVWMGAPRRRAWSREAEEGALRQRESVWGLRAGSGGCTGAVGGAGLTYLSSAPPLPVT